MFNELLLMLTTYFSAHPVAELTFILLLILIVVGLTRLFNQPILIGYIIAGIIVSPTVFDLVQHHEGIKIFAELGIVILLFMVGMGLNPKIIKKLGKVSVIAWLSQILLTFGVWLVLAYLLGFSWVTALYIAIGLTFSSTIVIVKLLSDNKEMERLYAKLSLGILIMQDIVAMLVLMVVAMFAQSYAADLELAPFIGILVAKITLSLAGVWLFSRFVLNSLMEKVAKSQEYLLLFSLGRCLVLASLFSVLGFSIEIGALLAGISLASSPYRHQVSSKLKSLRDFFVAMFFVYLGLGTSFDNIFEYWLPILVFSLFVLILQPMIVMGILGFMGYTKRNSFLTGLTLAQISEFWFIVLSLGAAAGHLQDERIVSMIIIVGLITIAGSSYFFAFNNRLFKLFSPYLSIFEIKGKKVDEKSRQQFGYTTLVYGYHRIGKRIIKTLKKQKEHFLVIDFNPVRIEELETKEIPCLYGDATDDELLDEIPLGKLKNVIITVSDYEVNLAVLKRIKKLHPHAKVIVVANTVDEANLLYELQADYVIMPHFLGSSHAISLLKKYPDNQNIFDERRTKHRKKLQHAT